MFLRSRARINNNTGKGLATKRRIQSKHLPIKKRRNPSRKAAYQASKSWRLTPTYTEFSVDDDKPLTYFTRTANLNITNQIQEGSSSKNGAKSDQDNSSDNQLFNETRRWMDKSAPGVPPPETFKVPKKKKVDEAKVFNAPVFRPTLEEFVLGGIEVNLAKLYYVVQRHGGLKAINRKTWYKIREEVCGKINNPDKKLNHLYVNYLVPYDTLTERERQDMLNKMEELWLKRNKKMRERAAKPLHRQKRLLGETDSSDEEDDERRYPHMINTLKEAEKCIMRGQHMSLHTFKRVAKNTLKKHFPRGAAITEVEDSYWSYVLLDSEHVCVNSASIDTGPEGYGFTKNEDEPYGNHPWNLKMLSKNKGNVLRVLGPVLGLTVPTLHLGMAFSTSCWHRDPHGLPWMEYMHQGSSSKIWYGIPEQESERFRKAAEFLCPTSCQNKSVWLPSDTTMIPPNFLLERGVSLSRVVQNPGEFIIVFPKSYSCSICTISESVYFATNSWVDSINQVFHELRKSCSPSMFSLEQILISAARDPRASLAELQLVHDNLARIIYEEREHRVVVEAYYGLVCCSSFGFRDSA